MRVLDEDTRVFSFSSSLLGQTAVSSFSSVTRLSYILWLTTAGVQCIRGVSGHVLSERGGY